MMWFGQTGLKVNRFETGLNVNQFETGLSASVNGLKLAFRNNNWSVKPLLLLTTRVLAHNQGSCYDVESKLYSDSGTRTNGEFPYSNVR